MASDSARRWNKARRDANSMEATKPCGECGKYGAMETVRLSFRLDPRNWQKEQRVLCRRCRDELGFTLESYQRTETLLDQPQLRGGKTL